MRPYRLLLPPLASALLALSSLAQGIGSAMPKVELEGLALTKAASYDDYIGRAVLLEFFAEW